jgi:hypothetical protein
LPPKSIPSLIYDVQVLISCKNSRGTLMAQSCSV